LWVERVISVFGWFSLFVVERRLCGAVRRPVGSQSPLYVGYGCRSIRAMRRKFNAAVTKFHSPSAFSRPRIENSRNPITRLSHPNAGSISAFLLRYRLRPRWSFKRLRIRAVASPPAFADASPPLLLSRPKAT